MSSGNCDFGNQLTAASGRLKAHCLRLTLNQDNAEDLAQATLLRAWANQERFDGRNLLGWLFMIARNLFLTDRRRTRWDGGYVDDLQMAQLPSAKGSQEATVELADAHKALQELPADQAEALLLIGYGASYEEAAEELECALGTVKSRIARGRAALAQLIDG